MSLDGAFLHIVKEELMPLIGARADKIYQPSREELVISLRTLRDGAKKLFLSANSAAARVNLTEQSFDNPQQPPMFCMLMRKHLCGGKLLNIRQDGLERILYFDFECTNEIGDIVTNTLIAEIMGRHSNIILVRDGRVIDSIKRVTDDISSVRRVLPNIPYETPPRAERLNILETTPEEVRTKLENSPDRLSKQLTAVLEGISPVFARECAYYATKDVDAICAELGDSTWDKVAFFLGRAKRALNGEAIFTVISEPNGKKKDFCFVNIEQYSTAMVISHAESANSLLDAYFSAADRSERTKQRAHDLLKLLMNTYERISRKIELQKKELAECGEREVFRVCGDLINANIWRLEKGMTKCALEDFETGEPREIALDARLTPAQNAQKYYSEYRKLDTAEKMLTELITKGKEELVYIDSVFDCVSRTENELELNEIRRELREQGYLRGGNRAEDKVKKLSEPLKFRSSDGYDILVGKNNRQNDLLTFKMAKALDVWLHVKDMPGSHVIVRAADKSEGITDNAIIEAAQLAAYYSKGRGSSGVPVDYVIAKYVKKPAGAKPGMVIFTNNKTLYVTPDENVVDKLKADKKQ